MTTQKAKSENVIIEETQIIGDKIHIIWYDKTIKSEKYNETQIEALDFIKNNSESFYFEKKNVGQSIMTIPFVNRASPLELTQQALQAS